MRARTEGVGGGFGYEVARKYYEDQVRLCFHGGKSRPSLPVAEAPIVYIRISMSLIIMYIDCEYVRSATACDWRLIHIPYTPNRLEE